MAVVGLALIPVMPMPEGPLMQTMRTLWLHEGRLARVAVRGVSNTVLRDLGGTGERHDPNLQ
jgi:hypothetical protein